MQRQLEKQVMSVLVDNHAGVLARVVSLFSRRGFNIDSLTVSATNNPALSRITIVAQGDKVGMEQVMQQTGKLVETRSIVALDTSHSLLRELLLVKVEADESNRGSISEIAGIYKAKIIDLSVKSMVMELTGEPTKIDAFLGVLAPYRIIEMCRTGVTALARGADSAESAIL